MLGGYVEHVTRLHPDAPIPAVYASKAVFDTIARFRDELGDERFFARLNEQAEAADEGWGDLGAGWTDETYERAANAAADRFRSSAAVSNVVATFLPGHGSLLRTQGLYLDIDAGLAVMSQHASALGYDAVVLFLDELVLWLMTRLADQAFVSEEATKVSKLVEAAAADRPAPLVSFVARQRDLRELVGRDIPGAERLSLLDALKWWEERFATITLEDRNLPAIAEHRILAPKSADAKRTIDEAFDACPDDAPCAGRRHPPRARGRRTVIPTDVPVHAGVRRHARRRVVGAPAGTDGAQGDGRGAFRSAGRPDCRGHHSRR